MNECIASKAGFGGNYYNVFALLGAFVLITACSYKPPKVIEQRSEKTFEETIQDAEFIISENNFRITGSLKIGSAIRKRNDSGFPLYEIILFCNLSYAEEMLSLDADFIYHCPYRLSISERKDGIVVGTVLLPENAGSYEMRKISAYINTILRKIVKYAAEDEPFLMDELDFLEKPDT